MKLDASVFKSIKPLSRIEPSNTSISTINKGKLTRKRVLKALRWRKELSAQALLEITGLSNTGIHSAINRLIEEGKVERIKNPEQEYGKPSYLFKLVRKQS